jgi:hypothetical protein
MNFRRENDTSNEIVVPNHVWAVGEALLDRGFGKLGKLEMVAIVRDIWGTGTLLKSKQFIEFLADRKGKNFY